MTPVRILLAVLFALLPAAAQALPGASNPTIVVAVIATLSGPAAMAGQDAVDGFAIGMRHLGGRFANQEVRVVVQDDKSSPDSALAAARKLLEREKVDFIVTAVSLPSMAAMAPVLLSSKALILNLDAAPEGLAGAGCSPWFFQVGTPVQAVYDGIVSHLAAEKMRRIVLIGSDSPASQEAAAAIRRAWPGEVTEFLRPRHGAARFTEEVTAIRRAAPDAVVTLLTGGMGGAFAREYAAAGLRTEAPLLGTWAGWERPQLPAMTEAGMDVLNVAPWSPDLETPLGRRLVADFEQEFGRPVTGWAAHGYDAAQLLEAAMRSTGGRTNDRDALRNALRRAEFPSVRGAFRFDPNHFPVVGVYLRRTTRDAKGRPNEELRATLIREWHSREAAACPMRWADDPALAQKPGGAQAPKPPSPATAQPAAAARKPPTRPGPVNPAR